MQEDSTGNDGRLIHLSESTQQEHKGVRSLASRLTAFNDSTISEGIGSTEAGMRAWAR